MTPGRLTTRSRSRHGERQRPATPAERTLANKNKAVSFAAYAALVDLFPARQTVYAGHMSMIWAM
jgi:Domain of unknown function (DUF6851)